MIGRSLPVAFALLLGLVGWSGSLSGHATPDSAINLDFGEQEVSAEIIVPVSELGYVTDARVNLSDPETFGRQRASLLGYVTDRFGLRTPDGRRWILEASDARLSTEQGRPDLVASLTLKPPRGATTRRFTLEYSGVIESTPDHIVLIFARSDFRGGRLSTEPRMLGALQGDRQSMPVDLGPGSAWRGFFGAVGVGMEHIAIGHDHLLFLLALILPAPLIAGAGRWGGYGGLRRTVHNLLSVVTAFTIGHSITLLGGAFLDWQLPGRPVEMLIALSILISAIHAFRPIFAGREAWIAAGFGLVHGLAFATIISNYGVESLRKAQSILGFNIGIEIVQLLVIAALFPSLILFARSRHYGAVRIGGALVAGIAATAWLVERIFNTSNPVAGAIDRLLTYGPWIILVVTIAALAVAYAGQREAGAVQPS